ncbi:hypothetical protein A7K91_20415 [Paenibacillus oryzae]|uniref:Uncharacterized protein n=1 Tax=Paenibacillus oryzae TaxID=1844972 RepID=A0A1A5YEP5_9BACL|nr:hypothetical protein A7K91_20415 [Paenibacillus oryzae]
MTQNSQNIIMCLNSLMPGFLMGLSEKSSDSLGIVSRFVSRIASCTGSACWIFTAAVFCMKLRIKGELLNAIRVVIYEKSYNIIHSEGVELYFCAIFRTSYMHCGDY